MGNCSQSEVRKTARSKIKSSFINSNKCPLILSIKTWNGRKSINLAQMENAEPKDIQVDLADGEIMQININDKGIRQNLTSSTSGYLLNCAISKAHNQYTIEFPPNNIQVRPWRFISNWTQIQTGAMIKIGLSVYSLKKLCLPSSNISNGKEISSFKHLQNSGLVTQEFSESDRKCRICFSSEQSSEDPLLSPCSCSGSVKYSHMKCLSKWMFELNEDNKENGNQASSIQVRQSICQVCKTNIIDTEEYARILQYRMSQLYQKSSAYAVFEGIRQQMNGQPIKKYLFMDFQFQSHFSIGRSTLSSFCDLDDKTISKIHTQIKLEDNKLYLRDCDSLHGTFLRIEDRFLQISQKRSYEKIIYRNMLIEIFYTSANKTAKSSSLMRVDLINFNNI